LKLGPSTAIDIQITNSPLRDITGGLGATIDEGSWISTSYLTGEIVIIPLTAWLSRLHPTASTRDIELTGVTTGSR
jgi:hypothetical protein